MIEIVERLRVHWFDLAGSKSKRIDRVLSERNEAAAAIEERDRAIQRLRDELASAREIIGNRAIERADAREALFPEMSARIKAERQQARAAAFEEAAGIAETAVIEPDDTEQPGDDDWFSRMCANGQATVIASAIRSRRRRAAPMDNPSWPEYYMAFAHLASTKSKDSTQVGAVLVGPDGEIRLSGYNGPPRGVEDLPERRERPAKYLFASHAEANLVAFAAREGIRTKGCTVYVTHHPCSGCARSLIQAGIECVVVGPGQTSMPADEFEAAAVMFAEAGVKAMLLSDGALDE